MENQLTEGSAWFWRIFGGTILGAITFLLVAHITSINNSIDKVYLEAQATATDIRNDLKLVSQQVSLNKERLALLEQNNPKDKLVSLEVGVAKNSERMAAVEAALEAFKEENKSLREQVRELEKSIQSLRERLVSIEKPAPQPSQPESTTVQPNP